MISKEKKTAIMNEYARTPGDTGNGNGSFWAFPSASSVLRMRSTSSLEISSDW